jgi:hypothetical protein
MNNNLQTAVLQFRGMTDTDRLQCLERIRFEADSHPDRDRRTQTRTLLSALERTHADILRERADMEARIKKEILMSVRPSVVVREQADISPERADEMRRGMFAAGVLICGVGLVVSVLKWVVLSGYVPLILGGGLVIFLLSAIGGGSAAPSDKYSTPAPSQGPQTIQVNITGHGGTITLNQQPQQ